MFKLTNRSFYLGIVYVVSIILIISVSAFYLFISNENSIPLLIAKSGVIQIAYYFFYINLLILVSNIVSRFPEIQEFAINLNRLIKLEIYNAILIILMSFIPFYGLAEIYLILRIVIVILYVIVFFQIIYIRKEDFPEIIDLRFFAFAFIGVLFISIFIDMISQFDFITFEINPTDDHNYKNILFRAIPFIFLIRFFVRTKNYEYYQT